ncbi:putative Prolyl endopeptidase-like [Babesia divergens]|uniref:Prolyl endopeptidase-like n=1 Tax=Babesia divergens TaxID=32595 RepID=A0AAD9GHU6_BABDI|nr:putative Prolyl endopeptidase-like [Babesia divergens]
MPTPVALHMRRLHDALFKAKACLPWTYDKTIIDNNQLITQKGLISSYTRLFNDGQSSKSGHIEAMQSSHIHGEKHCKEYNQNVESSTKGAVSTAIENYKSLISCNAEQIGQIQHLVFSESRRICGPATGRIDYEVFGQYAYFPSTEVGDNNPVRNENTNESAPTSLSEGIFLARAKLPSSRQMNQKRLRGSYPSGLGDGVLFRRPQRIFTFGEIKTADGHHINDVESLRVFPNRGSRAILAIIHRHESDVLRANFISIGNNTRGNVQSGTICKPVEGVTTLKASLSGIGEIHFMPHGIKRDDHLARVFYTLVNKQERAWQLRLAYVHMGRGVITNDRAILTEYDPTRFISLYKSKDGLLLYVAIVSHSRTVAVKCIRRMKKLVLYDVPLPKAKKVLLEHRSPYIYSVYNSEARSVDHCKVGYIQTPIPSACDMEHSNVHSVVCKMHDKLLKPVHPRFKRHHSEGSATGTYRGHRDALWNTVSLIRGTTVADIDMMDMGLVMYSYTPPSWPKILLIPFKPLRRGGKVNCSGSLRNGVYEVKLPVRVGVIEPQPNANFSASKVAFVVNAPGTSDVKCEIDLGKVNRAASADNAAIIPSGAPNTVASKQSTGNQFLLPQGDLFYTDVFELNEDVLTSATGSFDVHVCVSYAASREDGCSIPLTLVRSSDDTKGSSSSENNLSVFQHGGHKCVLYVYGAYGERLKATNDLEHNSLLKLGYTLCFAHVRGGGELGDTWHSDGSKLRKHVGFSDLVDVMEFLLAKDIAQRNKLAVVTESAGGILGGCVYNMRPDLCSCVLLKLPFLDVYNTILDSSQPLIQLEHEEFGEPMDYNLDYIYSYNPCSNPKASAFAKPSLIIQCNEGDLRSPWQHSAAFVGLHCKQLKNIFMKISHGMHVDGTSYDESVKLIAERIALIDHLLS